MKNKKTKSNGEESPFKWFITVSILTFILSLTFSYISSTAIANINIILGIILLLVVILIGILFDIIAIAVTVANEHEFHAKATKKVEGSKTAVKLIRNSSKVANFCADVIGDICGVLSGAIGAIISMKITEKMGLEFNVQFIISALVASLTVGGKALGKNVAKENSTPIVHFISKFIGKR